jgi:hypothetical protein
MIMRMTAGVVALAMACGVLTAMGAAVFAAWATAGPLPPWALMAGLLIWAASLAATGILVRHTVDQASRIRILEASIRELTETLGERLYLRRTD